MEFKIPVALVTFSTCKDTGVGDFGEIAEMFQSQWPWSPSPAARVAAGGGGAGVLVLKQA